MSSFLFKPNEWYPFRAGQHIDIRLTAPDGYQAQRSYSVASAPERGELYELVVERLDDGEVSAFLHDIAEIGDDIEMRGPFGGHFSWDFEDGGPLLLIGGGSGVAPLMSILRHRIAGGGDEPVMLIAAARSWEEFVFRDELLALDTAVGEFTLFLSLSRDLPRRPQDLGRRLDREFLKSCLTEIGSPPRLTYVCGSNVFVEAITGYLVDLGVREDSIRAERFGG